MSGSRERMAPRPWLVTQSPKEGRHMIHLCSGRSCQLILMVSVRPATSRSEHESPSTVLVKIVPCLNCFRLHTGTSWTERMNLLTPFGPLHLNSMWGWDNLFENGRISKHIPLDTTWTCHQEDTKRTKESPHKVLIHITNSTNDKSHQLGTSTAIQENYTCIMRWRCRHHPQALRRPQLSLNQAAVHGNSTSTDCWSNYSDQQSHRSAHATVMENRTLTKTKKRSHHVCFTRPNPPLHDFSSSIFWVF